MNKIFSNKIMLYGSIMTLIYFLLLRYVHIAKIDVVIIGVFVELLTIPFILLLLLITFFSVRKIIVETSGIKFITIFTLSLSILTIALLVFLTIFE